MFKINIIAKLTPNGIPGAVDVLGINGKSYTLYFRVSILGFNTGWVPVKFMDNFPA